MGIKERVENNPILFFVGAVVVSALTVGGAVAGVEEYFTSNRIDRLNETHELKISKLEGDHLSDKAELRTKLDILTVERQSAEAELQASRSAFEAQRQSEEAEHNAEINLLNAEHQSTVARYESRISEVESLVASIRRRVGGDSGYLDVKTFLLSRDQASEVSLRSRFFSDDGFYASADEARWSYSKITENELATLLSDGPVDSSLPDPPLHLWRGNETLPVNGSDLFTAVFPHVFLQKLPLEEFRRYFELDLSLDEDISIAAYEDAQQFIDATEKVFRGDVVGFLLVGALAINYELSLDDPEIGFKLIELQKVGPVLYAEFLTTLQDVTVGDTYYPTYYLREELILVSTATEVYLIRTFLPSGEFAPRGEYFAAVTEWFADLVIFIN